MNSKQKYLIVEDSINVCEGIKKRVDDFPSWHCCSFAHHVEDAITTIKEHLPSLIFMDWSIKGGSAYEVLQFIENSQNYNPYIIFNTGYQSENPEIPQEITNNYKIDKYLIKPIWENLAQNLSNYLSEASIKADDASHIKKSTLWLVDVDKKRHHINLKQLSCIVQYHGKPYCKDLHFTHHQHITVKMSWEKLIAILSEYELDFFVVHSRYAIIIKDHVACYERPVVRIHHPSIKIEVVREKLRDFEKWLEA